MPPTKRAWDGRVSYFAVELPLYRGDGTTKSSGHIRLMVREPKPDEECPISFADIGKCELPAAATPRDGAYYAMEHKDKTAMTVAKCGHSFNALHLLHHFIVNKTVLCPMCRGGPPGMQLRVADLPPHLVCLDTRRRGEGPRHQSPFTTRTDALSDAIARQVAEWQTESLRAIDDGLAEQLRLVEAKHNEQRRLIAEKTNLIEERHTVQMNFIDERTSLLMEKVRKTEQMRGQPPSLIWEMRRQIDDRIREVEARRDEMMRRKDDMLQQIDERLRQVEERWAERMRLHEASTREMDERRAEQMRQINEMRTLANER